MHSYERLRKRKNKMKSSMRLTFQNILQRLRRKTEEQYAAQKGAFVRKKIPKVITNVLCTVFVFVLVLIMPHIVGKLSEVTGYGQEETAQVSADQEAPTETQEPEEETVQKPIGRIMVISVDAANIRSGPGTDYGVVAAAKLGDMFTAIGNQETASNDRIWYEIYLDAGMTQTGWASEKVIEFQ